MEGLRILPVAMFLTGILLMYAGFKNVSPMDVIRRNIGQFQAEEDRDQGYGITDDPLYHRPIGRQTPGGYY